MSTSSAATDRWKQILSQKKYDFRSIGLDEALRLVNNRKLFRKFFEDECKQINYKRTQTALGKLWNSFNHIGSFIKMLEGATLDQGDKGYTSMIWGSCAATVQCVSTNFVPQISPEEAFDGPDGIIQIVADLNHSLPDFKEDLTRGYELSIQAQDALQDIFETYVNCCISIICLRTERTPPSSLTWKFYIASPRAYIEQAAKVFMAAKNEFSKAINSPSVSGGVSAARPRGQSSIESSRRSLQIPRMPGTYPSNTQCQVFEEYHIDRNLGHGAFGYVEQVTDTSSGKVYARKHIKLPKRQDWIKFQKSVGHEIENMRSVACIHVVNVEHYREVADHAMEIYMTPVADKNLKEILDGWVDGDYPKLGAWTMYSWFGCLLRALDFVHQKDVVHKDIKPSNILIKDNMVYLADFGLSRSFDGGASWTAGPFAGTLEYQAPEYVTGQKHGRSVDTFALACVFAEILTALHRQDREEFQECRLVTVLEHQLKIYSYHKCLDRIEEWVNGLRGNEIDNVLVDAILGMLNVDTVERKKRSEQALKSFQSTKELRCTHKC